MYRESSSATRRKGEDGPNILERFVSSAFLMGYFTLLPIIITIMLNWAAYFTTAESFFGEPWMMPSLLLLGTFLAGAMIRQKIEDDMGGMWLFFLGILALILFAALTHQDIEKLGGIYSKFMPKLLASSMDDYVLMLPAIGIVGMLFYKYFTLKHYS